MTTTEFPSAFVEANGVNVHYVRLGRGRPLVFLHGWPEFWRIWRKNLPVLAASFDCIAPDWRGFGRSRSLAETDPPQPITPDSLAADLKALLDKLGLGKVGLIGHDIGAMTAQAFARAHPERLAGLFFFDCPYPGIGGRWANADQLPEIWYQTFNQQAWAPALVGYNRDTCRLYLQHFLKHWAYDKTAFADDLEAWVDNFMAPGALAGGFAWYRGIDAMRRAIIRDGPPKLPAITVPTRILWGEADPVVRHVWSDRLGDYFQDFTLDILPRAGHFAPFEQPDVANAEIERFFGQRFAAA